MLLNIFSLTKFNISHQQCIQTLLQELPAKKKKKQI
jgi:hypothetical protein